MTEVGEIVQNDRFGAKMAIFWGGGVAQNGENGSFFRKTENVIFIRLLSSKFVGIK